MKIHNELETADKVWEILKQKLADIESDREISFGSYQNGREQGYSLLMYDYDSPSCLWIGWAQDRNSDDIVVYFDSSDPMQGVSDEAYYNAKYFYPDQIEMAADSIIAKINEFLCQAEVLVE